MDIDVYNIIIDKIKFNKSSLDHYIYHQIYNIMFYFIKKNFLKNIE